MASLHGCLGIGPATHPLQHLNSHVHRGSTTRCPLCTATFTTATGVVHHLERGACPNTVDMDRVSLYKFIRSKDPNGIISKKLIGWRDEPRYEATNQAWNGCDYECYFCHRLFGQLSSLNQHLQSPVRKYNSSRACSGVQCIAEYEAKSDDRPASSVSLSQSPMWQGLHNARCYYQPFRERILRIYALRECPKKYWRHAERSALDRVLKSLIDDSVLAFFLRERSIRQRNSLVMFFYI